MVSLMTAFALWVAMPVPTVRVAVRWKPGLSDAARARLERTFSLRSGQWTEGTVWRYGLADASPDNLRSLLTDPHIVDSDGIDRNTFTTRVALQSRMRPLILGSVAAGVLAALVQGIWLLRRHGVTTMATVGAVATIIGVVTITYWPVLTSGNRVLFNGDFFQFLARHESVAQSIWWYHELPLRSPWLGGGFNTIADPEDPTLNPLVLLSVALGPVNGIKAIGYLSLLIASLSTYAFARRILGYTQWGALYSALVFGTCLFLPGRLAGGNPNELYGVWVPACLLLVGLSRTGRRWPVVMLSLVFYTMLTDGKQTALMVMAYVGILSVLAIVSNGIFSGPDRQSETPDYQPLVAYAVALGLTFLIGLPRLLPLFELMARHGGIVPMLAQHPVNAYFPSELWTGVLGLGRPIDSETLSRDLVTVGVIPVVLSGIALLVFFRQTIAWALVTFLFCWLILAQHAPIDLAALLRKLPILDAIERPYKSFSFEIAFTLSLIAGRTFGLLRQFQSRRVEAVIALVLIAFSVGFLEPRASAILAGAFTHDEPDPGIASGFYNVAAAKGVFGLHAWRAVPYLNMQRNVGTSVGYFSAVAVDPVAVAAKYVVNSDDQYIANPAYRGEAYFDDGGKAGDVLASVFKPDAMLVSVNVKEPATLLINQNYDRSWHTDRGILSASGGLIAVRLPDVGSYTVTLRYVPIAFYAGVALTSLGLAALVIVDRRRRARDVRGSRK